MATGRYFDADVTRRNRHATSLLSFNEQQKSPLNSQDQAFWNFNTRNSEFAWKISWLRILLEILFPNHQRLPDAI